MKEIQKKTSALGPMFLYYLEKIAIKKIFCVKRYIIKVVTFCILMGVI